MNHREGTAVQCHFRIERNRHAFPWEGRVPRFGVGPASDEDDGEGGKHGDEDEADDCPEAEDSEEQEVDGDAGAGDGDEQCGRPDSLLFLGADESCRGAEEVLLVPAEA